jgi:hypothetical protein
MTGLSKYFLVLAVPLAGCLANPATNIAATGEPLRLKLSSGTGSYVSNDVVATEVHRDASGSEIGTTERYQPVEHSYRWQDREYFQGHDALDEHDYYRLAGDREAADQIGRIREGAARKMRIGAPLMIAGVAATIVATTIGISSNNSSITTLGYVGGSTITSVGGLVWYWGHNTMRQRHHLPASRAERNADLVEECVEGSCRTRLGARRQTWRSIR